MEILYASGIRRAELVGLNLADVDLERRVMRVIGKGNKQRMVFINRRRPIAIRQYLSVRPRSADEALVFKPAENAPEPPAGLGCVYAHLRRSAG